MTRSAQATPDMVPEAAQPEYKVCIVMPVLDEGEALLPALLALQPLRLAGARLVVVDGGSRDATWPVARHLADELRLAPRGRARQMNAGAAAAAANAQTEISSHDQNQNQNHNHGNFSSSSASAMPNAEVLLFLHADTRLPPQALHAIRAALAGGAQWGRFDVRIAGRPWMLRVVATLMNLRSRLTGIATGDQAIFVRSDAFERLGGFALQPLMEDIAFSRQARRTLGAPACLREKVVTSGRRWERHGVWRTIFLMWSLRAAYFFGAPASSLAQRYGYAAAEPAPATTAVAILAKAPVPGLAKTRLAPLLGAAGSARAQRGFILQTLHAAQAAQLGPVTLWCAPDVGHRLFRVLRRRCDTLACKDQPAGDLGERMLHAMHSHFKLHPGVPLLIVGTDCPLLSPGQLHAAARALQTHDAVLVPAHDGGYVAIGLKKALAAPFAPGMPWSTPTVLAQTLERLRSVGITAALMPALPDVDEPLDWLRLHERGIV